MKALDRRRDQRYAMPRSLADDIGRFLRGEVVEAGPPSATYHVRKFILRHRVSVAATCGVLVALLVGLLVSMSLYQDALRSAAEARDARSLAETSQASAESLGTYVVAEVLTELENSSRLGLLEPIAVRALEYFEVLEEQGALQPTRGRQVALLKLAKILRMRGNFEGARRGYEYCLAKARQLREVDGDEGGFWRLSEMDAYGSLAEIASEQGRLDEALEKLGHALTIGREAIVDLPDDWKLKTWMARIRHENATIKQLHGDAEGALELLQQSAALLEKLPNNHRVLLQRAQAYLSMGRIQEASFKLESAEASYTAALAAASHEAIDPQHRYAGLMRACTGLGLARCKQDVEQARRSLEQCLALEMWDPLNERFRRVTQEGHITLAKLLGRSWRFAESLTEAKRALAKLEQLEKPAAARPRYATDAAEAHLVAAGASAGLGRPDEALVHCDASLAALERLSATAGVDAPPQSRCRPLDPQDPSPEGGEPQIEAALGRGYRRVRDGGRGPRAPRRARLPRPLPPRAELHARRHDRNGPGWKGRCSRCPEDAAAGTASGARAHASGLGPRRGGDSQKPPSVALHRRRSRGGTAQRPGRPAARSRAEGAREHRRGQAGRAALAGAGPPTRVDDGSAQP